MSSVIVAALYKFVSLPDYESLREPLSDFCHQQRIKGTLLLAAEGINGTVSGSREGIDALQAWFAKDARFEGLEYKESLADEHPFLRLKIKLKKEIVTMGVDDVDPNVCVGQYVTADQWNRLISDPEVLLVDARNDYEYEIGTFKGAINPNTESFREFPAYMEALIQERHPKKIAMFCTGGIRCEKATSLVKKLGIDAVYHLKGGILKYLEDVPRDQSLWEGECFVFDHRISVMHGLEQGTYDQCYGCRYPITEDDKQSPLYERGVSCPRCHDQLTDDQRQRFRERQKQIDLSSKRGKKHIGTY